VIERGFCRIGNEPIQVDVRVMAATNRDLAAAVKEEIPGDLFWRLQVLSLTVCPRAAAADIPLCDHIVGKLAARCHSAACGSAQTMALLTRYEWPGNVRELQNCIYSAMTVSEGSSIEPNALPERIHKGTAGAAPGQAPSGDTCLAQVVTHATEKAEKEAIQRRSPKRAATGKNRRVLGIGRTLYRGSAVWHRVVPPLFQLWHVCAACGTTERPFKPVPAAT
jgi:DNA-binding NtrC family response regulator